MLRFFLFQVYERGVDLFTYPIAFEIWNTYLSKFMKRYVSPLFAVLHWPGSNSNTSGHQGGDKIERARDLFEQALEKCPPKFAKPLFLLYGQLEEEHGLAKRAMGVYDRATLAVEASDRMEVSSFLAFLDASRNQVLTLVPHRCLHTTSRRQRPTLVCLPRDPSTRGLLNLYRTNKLLRCVCGSLRSRGSWEKLIVLGLSLLMLVNSVTPG